MGAVDDAPLFTPEKSGSSSLFAMKSSLDLRGKNFGEGWSSGRSSETRASAGISYKIRSRVGGARESPPAFPQTRPAILSPRAPTASEPKGALSMNRRLAVLPILALALAVPAFAAEERPLAALP